jgi:Calcium binding
MARSAAPKIDLVREYRIDYEIVVDTYNEYKAAIGWLTYLQEHLNFPFEAMYHPEDEQAHQVTVQDLEYDEEALNQRLIEFNVEIDDDGELHQHITHYGWVEDVGIEQDFENGFWSGFSHPVH